MKKLFISLAVLFAVSFAAWAVVTGPNFNLPDATSMTKISDSFEQLRTNEVWTAKMDFSSTPTNTPTGAMAFDKTNKYLMQWNGASWANFNLNHQYNVGIFTASPNYPIDISSAGGIFMGADYYAGHLSLTTRTNSVAKETWMIMPDYATSYPVTIFRGQCGSGVNYLTMGGGNNYTGFDGMTKLMFYTAVDSVTSTGTEKMNITNSEIAVNDPGAAFNFRVESDHQANMLYVDGTNDRVGIANAAPAVALDVTGGIAASTTLAVAASVLTANVVSGKVGIGTAAPGGILEIVGSTTADSTAAGVIMSAGTTGATGYTRSTTRKMVMVSDEGTLTAGNYIVPVYETTANKASHGFGYAFANTAEVQFRFDDVNGVTLVSNTSNVANTDTAVKFSIYVIPANGSHGTYLAMKNNFSATVTVGYWISYGTTQ